MISASAPAVSDLGHGQYELSVAGCLTKLTNLLLPAERQANHEAILCLATTRRAGSKEVFLL